MKATYWLWQLISRIHLTPERHFQHSWTIEGGQTQGTQRDDKKPAIMASQKSRSPIGGVIMIPSFKKDIEIVAAGEASDMAGARCGMTPCMSFTAASEQ